MDISLECIYCTIKKADSLFNQNETVVDKDKKLKFMKEVFKIISLSKKGDTSPYLNAQIIRLLDNEFNLGDIYYEIKKEYNQLLISMEDEILECINTSKDKLLTALKFAMVGNFIDFGAMDKVDINELKNLIKNALEEIIDFKEYEEFLEELKNAKQIVYIIDNAGEIVFDKIFIKVIKKIYSDVIIDVIIRGKPAYNDATIIDAKEVGLCNIVNVVENGMNIPDTQLNQINTNQKI